MQYIIRLVYGMIFGIANIIPGVSGGTIAVILNIYDKLIGSLTNLKSKFKDSLLFLIPFGIGAGIGIFMFSKLLKYLLEYFPMPTNFFFIGLIIGGVPLVFKKATETKFKPISIIPFVIAFCGIIALAVFGNVAEAESGTVEVAQTVSGSVLFNLNIWEILWLIVGSAISAISMLIPGVSGSMVMMILGLYTGVLNAISDLDILYLIPVAIGIVTGIFAGAKLIEICMQKAPQATFFAIIGLMLGSLYSVWLNSGASSAVSGLYLAISIVALLVGFSLSYIFGSEKIKKRLTHKRNSGTNQN